MNKRIQELWEQAVHGDGPHASVIADFAELIINECLRMCDCAEASLLEHSYPRESDGAASVKIFIKEHFGVEE